jgi:hypothetical protein
MASDYVSMHRFPEGTGVALAEVLTDTPDLTRNGWRMMTCSFSAPPNRSTIDVELAGPGGRVLRLHLRGTLHVGPATIESGSEDERRPGTVARLAEAVLAAAEARSAGSRDWFDA